MFEVGTEPTTVQCSTEEEKNRQGQGRAEKKTTEEDKAERTRVEELIRSARSRSCDSRTKASVDYLAPSLVYMQAI